MEKLKELRIKSKLTQKEVADALEITRPYYTMLENSVRKPSLVLGMRIAAFYKVPAEEIFGNIK